MTDPITPQQPPEGWLRRWWRSFHGAVGDMDTSGNEHMFDRIDDLEKRVERLEVLLTLPTRDQAPGD